MKGYWLILGTEITDATSQAEYGRQWGPVAAKYGAKLATPTSVNLIEKRADTARIILVEFPTFADAKACLEDAAYAEAAVHALKASRRDLVIFEGNLS